MKAIFSAGSTGSSTSSLMKVATLRLLTTRKMVGFLRAGAGAAGAGDIEMEAAVALFERIGRQAPADRRARGRAVGEVKASVVLRAFDDVVLDQAVGEMGIAMGADAVGGVELARGVAAKGVGFLAVVETDDVGAARGRRRRRLRSSPARPAWRPRSGRASLGRAFGSGSLRFTW